VIAALLLSALMAAAAVAAAPAPGPIVKDGVEITVLPQIGVAGAPGAVTEVGLDIEAKTADAATRLGFQSLHAIADVDCGKGANRFINAEAYDQPGLAGAGRQRNVTGQWVQPSSDSFMAAVIGRICAAPATVATAKTRPPPVVREMAAAAPPPAPSAKAPAPAPQVAPPSDSPPPSPPQVVKFSRGAPVAEPLAAPKPAAAAPQAALAAPAPAPPPPSAPAPSPPLVVKFSGAPTGAAPTAAAAARTLATAPRVAGDRVAQVAASSNVHDAEKVLRELRPLIAAPLTTTIEQAVVGGAHVYRADVVGFSSAADAKAFCKSAAEVSKTCWVRAKGDTAAPAKPPEHLRPAKPAG
jgi:SPOR domain